MRMTKGMLAVLLSIAMLVSMVAVVPTVSAVSDDDILASFTFEGSTEAERLTEAGGKITATIDDANTINVDAEGKNGDYAAAFNAPGANQGVRWNADDFNPFKETGDQASVSMWVKFNSASVAGNTNIFSAMFSQAGVDPSFFLLKYDGGKLRFCTNPATGAGKRETQVEAAFTPVAGEWVLITYVQDGTNGKMYLNDALVGENGNMSAKLNQVSTATGGAFAIGCMALQWRDPSLNGAVDDFTVYNKALSVLEIAALAGGVNVDQDKIDAAEEAIAAIGTVELTDASLAKIEAAQTAYDALTDVEKEYVDDAALVAAWEAYYTLAEDENDGLVLYLDFEDGKATDIANRVDATVSGVTAVDGREEGNTAFQFGSDKSRNDNMYVKWDAAAYDPFARTENGATVNFWVKLQATNDFATLFSYGKGSSFVVAVPQANNWDGNNNAFRVAFKNNNSGETDAIGSKITTDEYLGKWVMLTITQDADRNTKMYVGGKLQGESTVDYSFYDIATTNDASSMTYALGYVPFFNDNNFQGAMDEFAIYNRALTEKEVAELAGVEYVDKTAKYVSDFVCYDDRANSNTSGTPMSDSWKVIGNVAVGERVYYDRTGIALAALPEYLVGADLISTAMSSKSSLTGDQTALEQAATFTVKQRATVYVALDSRVGDNSDTISMLTAAGFALVDGEVNFGSTNGAVLNKIYAKTFAKNETVSLPTQYIGSCNMYLAFVQGEEEPVEHDFTVTNSDAAVVANGEKYDITWNANVVLDEGVDLAALNEKATFTGYGVIYGTSAAEVAKAADGEATNNAKIKAFAEGGNIDVYTIFGFRLKGVAADKTRAAQFYVTYELDGQSYTVYSQCVEATAVIAE